MLGNEKFLGWKVFDTKIRLNCHKFWFKGIPVKISPLFKWWTCYIDV